MTIQQLGTADISICVHHWKVSTPRAEFSRSNARGDFIETTLQTCKKCGIERENKVVIPPERVR